MQVIAIVVMLCVGATIASDGLYGTEIETSEEWWNDNYYIKFNSPGGKTFYIDLFYGIIYREKDPNSYTSLKRITTTIIQITPIRIGESVPLTEEPINVEKTLPPFISFVSNDFTIYDIYFDNDRINSPRLEKSESVYHKKYLLIRPRLVSFVGPNKKVYQIIHNDDNEVTIAEKSSDIVTHFQIKTFGPYEKWEHTYDFSENGEIVLDHTISPIPVSADRSISLPKVESNIFITEKYLRSMVKFNSPSGAKYHITTQMDIVPIQDDLNETAYMTFTEPDGRIYDIHIDEKDGAASLVANGVADNYFEIRRLYSFIGPNRISYRISHRDVHTKEGDHEVPVLVSSPSDSSDLQLIVVEQRPHYNKFVQYKFSDNGKKLFDRVDDISWKPLNELPAVPVEEITTEHEVANRRSLFLILFTPSGNNYHFHRSGTNASIAVQKDVIRHPQDLYIIYLQPNGKWTHIKFTPGADPSLNEQPISPETESHSFSLLSFTTPDRKKYSIGSIMGDDNEWKPSIQIPTQVKEPIDLPPVEDLSITIKNENDWEYVYRFTWTGDKLVEASFEPPKSFVHSKDMQSQIGK